MTLWWFSDKTGSFFWKIWVHGKQTFYTKWMKSAFLSRWELSEPRWLKSTPLNGRFYSIYLRIQELLLLHGKFHVARSNSFSSSSSQGPCRIQFCKQKCAEIIFPKDKDMPACGYSNSNWNKVLNFPLGDCLAREEKKFKRWNFFQGHSSATSAKVMLSSSSSK